MIIQGNLDHMIGLLTKLKSTIFSNEDYSLKMSFDVYNNHSQLITISANDLMPIEDFSECQIEELNGSVMLVDKVTYDILKSSFVSKKHLSEPFLETEGKNMETNRRMEETALAKSCDSKATKAAVKRHQNEGYSPSKQTDMMPDTAEFSKKLIENHDYDCVKVNRPSVFAIKKMNTNYFLLYYRKSVYDVATDNAFRKYLNEQPGMLVAYKYIHSIDNLRKEYSALGLGLRHNGKNELSSLQVDNLLKTFTDLAYL